MITIESGSNSSFEVNLSPTGLSRFLNRARLALGIAGEVDVLLADDRTLRRLNRDFRGKNKSTDVLSFPSPPEISPLHAGDLGISLETAARQAETYGHSLRDEVRILLLHGLLHLAGLDHETDNGEMATREAALRGELRLPNTLIGRVSAPKVKPAGASATQRSAGTRVKTAADHPKRSATRRKQLDAKMKKMKKTSSRRGPR